MTRANARTESPTHPGKLGAFGLSDRRQIPLLMPSRLDDLTQVSRRMADLSEDERRLIQVTVTGAPTSRFDGRGPRAIFPVVDDDGATARAIIYGPPSEVAERLPPPQPAVLSATCRIKDNGEAFLYVNEIIPTEWGGRVRPTYPSIGKHLSSEEARSLVLAALPKYQRAAAEHVCQALAFAGPIEPILASLGCPGWTLEELIHTVHLPPTLRHGLHAQNALERLAALAGIYSAHAVTAGQGVPRAFTFASMAARIAALPHTLTGDQLNALRQIYREMRKPRPARVLLAGDVGTGKTLTFGAVAATVLDEGGRVAVMVPNTVLVEQIARELQGFWPDLVPACVTGEREAPPGDARLVIGTTALLHQNLGTFDLVIVDEMHKFARHQREHYVRGPTHLIEATATCIPRSLALVKLGLSTAIALRQTHQPKTITTRLFNANDRRALMAAVHETIAAGHQVLVVYPERGEDDPEGEPAPKGQTPVSVADASEAWARAFPGRVRTLTGADTAEVKDEVLSEMRAGTADILVGTTVVEVGVNLPRLRQVIVVMPERHGLAALHQIRGRVAREGGAGRMDLYCLGPLAPKSQRRLQILLDTNDGFEVATRDLALRGLGNLSRQSNKQSGADDYLIFNRPLRMESVQGVLPLWDALVTREKPPS